jgi:hypothetical protein
MAADSADKSKQTGLNFIEKNEMTWFFFCLWQTDIYRLWREKTYVALVSGVPYFWRAKWALQLQHE